jgi:polyisoprenoid-binding protein YceI
MHRLLLSLALPMGGAAMAQPSPDMGPAAGSGSGSAAVVAPAPIPVSGAASAATYGLDPTHTFVHWEVVHMGTSTIRGRFDKVVGNVQFDAKAHTLDVGMTIDTNSVDSGVPLLDALLRGSEMLDVKANPKAYFVAKNAHFEGEVPRELRGEFTLRGISQPLSLRALRWNCAINLVFRREVCGGDFEAHIDRSSFGITHSLPLVADDVRIIVQVEGIRQ